MIFIPFPAHAASVQMQRVRDLASYLTALPTTRHPSLSYSQCFLIGKGEARPGGGMRGKKEGVEVYIFIYVYRERERGREI
jgi:hypothetical protein